MRAKVFQPKHWTTQDHSFLREKYPDGRIDELARILGCTLIAVRARAKLLGLRRNRTYKPWTPIEKLRFARIFPGRSSEEVAKLLGRSLLSVCSQATKQGMHKSAEYLARLKQIESERLERSGAKYRFAPGTVPANKGLRRPGYSVGRGRMSETTFKKGQRSKNFLPIGTIRKDSDGYLRRKIAEGLGGWGNPKAWEYVHKRVWEDANGPIPKGFRIWWKDKNHDNCAIENLELLSGKEHVARTTIHRLPAELKETIMLSAVLTRKIRRTEKLTAEASNARHQGTAKASV